MVTTKTENCLRLLLLNAQGATPVLRETLINFVKQTSNKTLGDFLLAFEDLFKTLKSKHILSDAEYNKLVKGSAVNINEWDTSLLCTVINLCCTVTEKMHGLKDMLLKVANKDLDTFVKKNKANIDKYKGVYLSSEQYNTIFPANYMATNIELLDMEIITFLLLEVCDKKVQNSAIELLKRTLQMEMELKNSNLNLEDFLKWHESLLKKVELQRQIDKSQFEQLFPPNGDIPDINKWDNHTLRIVVLKCSSSIKQKTLEATKILRIIRNDLAHLKNFEMSSIKYNDQSTNLIKAMKVLTTEENLQIKATIDEELEKITEGPIELKSTLEILKSFYTKGFSDYQQILNHLEIVEKAYLAIETKVDKGFQRMDSRFDSLSEEMLKRFDKLAIPDSTYSEKAEIQCVDMIMVVRSQTEDGRIKAEDTIRTEIKKAGENSTEQIRAALLVIVEILKNDDRIIVEVKKGSIILTIKCISLKGLHRLLQYVASETINLHLKQLSSAMTEFVGESVKINVYMSESTVLNACQDVVGILFNYVDNTISLRMTLTAETVEELRRMLDEVKGESFRSLLRNLSEGLSTYIGEDINVDVVVPKIDARANTTENMESEKMKSKDTVEKEVSKVTPQTEVLQKQVCETITAEAREIKDILVNEDILKENEMLLKDIRKYTRLKKYVKPRCLLISMIGQGKSATINTLSSIFAGGMHHRLVKSVGHNHSKTLRLSKFESYGITNDDYYGSNVDENIKELKEFLPTLINVPGFGNINSEGNRQILELIIAGKIPFGVSMTQLHNIQDKHGVRYLDKILKHVEPDRKIDKIIFIHACNEPVPNQLIECLNTVLAMMDKKTGRFKYDVDVVALITKYDSVMERSKLEGDTDYKRLITMQQYRKLEGDLARLLNIEGALENNRFQWVNLCDDVGYDTKNPNIANNVYKLTRRLMSPLAEVDSKGLSSRIAIFGPMNSDNMFNSILSIFSYL